MGCLKLGNYLPLSRPRLILVLQLLFLKLLIEYNRFPDTFQP